MDTTHLQDALHALQRLLGPELGQIIDAIADEPGPNNIMLPDLPEAYDTDRDVTELMSAVARTSNTYYRCARFAGMAKAETILAESRYKAIYKSNLIGPNENERQRNAVEASREAQDAYSTADSIRAIAESMENAARVASESARKLLDKVQAMQIATHREEHGQLNTSDFRSY